MPGIHIVISLKGAKLQILNQVLIWQRRAKRQFISTFFFFFAKACSTTFFLLRPIPSDRILFGSIWTFFYFSTRF